MLWNHLIPKRESPSLAKGVRLRLLSLRGSWVQIPSPASNLLTYFSSIIIYSSITTIFNYLKSNIVIIEDAAHAIGSKYPDGKKVGSCAYSDLTIFSFHPVKVDLDEVTDKGVVLALYGKVELEAQRDEIENAMWQVPNVVNVKNFIIAEDAVLNIATRRIEGLRSKGKLEGATDISVLVENAILHLYGQVPTDEMKRMLERELLGIPGVRVLVNHIGLNKEIPGNLGKTLNKIGQ